MGKDYVAKHIKTREALAARERDFLRACLRPGAPPPPIPDGLLWEPLLRRARGDGLAALLYRRWRADPTPLPPAVFARLRHDYYQNASANLLRLEELRRIGRRLGEASIPLLVLKGGALALTVYEDPALRFMGDVDVAVPPQQATVALRLLQEAGYKLHGAPGMDTVRDGKQLREQGWHLRLTKPVRGKRMELELHWPLRRRVLVAQVAELDVAGMWEHAIPLAPDDNLWQPAPMHMLLHLCLHIGLQHRFSDLGLRQYVDVDRVLRAAGDELAQPGTLATAAGAARAAHVTALVLLLTRTLLGTPLPPGLIDELRLPSWKARLFRRRFTVEDACNRRRVFYDRQRFWWRLLTIDRALDLAVGPWRTLFPGRAFLASYFRTQQPLRLAGYAAWYPLHALARAGRRRREERQRARR